MLTWFNDLTTWLVQLVQSFFSALGDFLHDLILWPVIQIFAAIAAAFNALPLPSFMTGGVTFGGLFSGLPTYALFFIGQMHFDQAFAIVGAGVTFRLIRKAVTLGQW